MKSLLAVWGEPAKISKRIYNKGCIEVKSKIVDIFLANDSDQTFKIGEAEIVEDEYGLYATNAKYNINEQYLSKLIDDCYEGCDKDEIGVYTSDLSLALWGSEKREYKDKNELELKHVRRYILSKDPIETIIRDIKINSLIEQ